LCSGRFIKTYKDKTVYYRQFYVEDETTEPISDTRFMLVSIKGSGLL